MQWQLCLKIYWKILNYHNEMNSYIWSVVESFACKRKLIPGRDGICSRVPAQYR